MSIYIVPPIPMLCLNCGNAVLTGREPHELKARRLETLDCVICAWSGNKGDEIFYVSPAGHSLSYGEWMDLLEAM